MSAAHEALRELSGFYVLGALRADERAEFDAHLATCVACRSEVAALRPVVAAMAYTVPQTAPPESLRDRVLRTVTGSEVRAGEVGTTDPAADVKVVPTFTRAARPVAAWMLAAASLAVAVALGGYSILLRNRIADLDARLQDALTQALMAQRQFADARRVAVDAQSQVAVLAAPDLVRIDLVGQPNAPTARARAFWSRAQGMVFTASDLPSLPAGRVYQVWALTAAGPPISVGLLEPGQPPGTTTVFRTSPDMPQPAQVAVSDEPAGGVPAPTGAIWLAGRPVA